MTNDSVPQGGLEAAAAELRALVDGEGAADEAVLQRWLEQHPSFVPGAFGPRGSSGWEPWPRAVITQPPLTGMLTRVPDFIWLARDSRRLTAVCIEIERPAKRWFTNLSVPHSDYVQARSQLNDWRTWFADPYNSVRVFEDFQVPSSERPGGFDQHYILVMGRREEYASDVRRTRLLASDERPDETLMSWDRLIELQNPAAQKFGCVRMSRQSGQYEIVSEPSDSSAGSTLSGSQDDAPGVGLRYKPHRRGR
jgi:Domain of unknown function (DUF4263)